MTTEVLPAEERRGGSLVRIVDTPDNIEKSWEDFQVLKRKVIKPEDLQAYTVGSGKNKQTKHFIKKSGWKKIGAAFGVDVQVQGCERIDFEPGYFAIKYTVRAIAPSGRYADGVGSCDNHEDRFEEKVWEGPEGSRKQVPTGHYKWKYNDIDGTAYTRAANRAISDLVGGGEVSAEEMTGVKDVTPAAPELSQKLQERLVQIASYQGEEGTNKLARLIFDEIGSRFLSVEQATSVAGKLKSGPTTKAPAPPTTNTTSQVEPIDPTIQERLHRAAWIEEAAHVQTCTPAGKWMSVTGDQFDKAAKIITGGRELMDIVDAMGIDKFSTEAKKRYPGQLKTYDQQLAAGLHVLAEWCENHPAETIFPDVEGGQSSAEAEDDFFQEDEEFDDNQEEFIK